MNSGTCVTNVRRRIRYRFSPSLWNNSFLPYLRRAIQNLTWKHNPAYSYVNTTLGENATARPSGSMSREFSVAFYNVPSYEGIRDLRMNRLGKLMSISGTVTRTSEVRPELLYGTFICKDCNGVMHNVEQQFKYTEVRFVFLPVGGRYCNWSRGMSPRYLTLLSTVHSTSL